MRTLKHSQAMRTHDGRRPDHTDEPAVRRPQRRSAGGLVRAGGLAGIAGPLLFAASVVIQSFLRRREYSLVSEPISALGAGPLGWIQSTTFAVLGLLTLVFAAGLYQALSTGLRWAGPSLVALTGVGLLLAAVFPLQRGEAGILYDPGLHAVGGNLFFGVGLLAVVVTTVQLFRDPRWRSVAALSAIAAALLIAAMPVVLVLTIPEDAPLHAVGGLVQAAVVTVRFTWQIVLARRLLRSTI